jgi:hypothetical protein
MNLRHTSLTRVLALLIPIVCAVAVERLPAHSVSQMQVIVKFSADDFWLNLHHFLYVLGRAQAGVRDAQRSEVAGAPLEQDEVLTTLTADDQRVWRDAVAFYASDLSRRDTVDDPQLVRITGALARIGPASRLDASSELPSDLAAMLERAASVYRKGWWPAHHRADQEWVAETQKLVDQHGPQILAFLTHAYQLPWPADGYPVHVSAYTNWAGAYSTDGPLLVISSVGGDEHGSAALETVFHEASHQWDDPVLSKLNEIGRSMGKKVPDGLTHAIIWMTAGEAVRHVAPGYVPIAETLGIWQRGANPTLRPSLESAWLPYLNGFGTRDEALTALMTLAGK